MKPDSLIVLLATSGAYPRRWYPLETRQPDRAPSRLQIAFPRQPARSRPLVTSSAIIVLALLVGFSVATWQAIEKATALRKMEQAEKLAVSRAKEAWEKTELADEAKRASQEPLYRANMVNAWDAWRIGNRDEAERLLERHRPGPGEDDFRSVEWPLLADELEPPELIHRFTTSGLPMNLAVSVDGRWIAVSQTDGMVVLHDRVHGSSPTLPIALTNLYARHVIAFSATGETLVAGGDDFSTFRVEHVKTVEGKTISAQEFVTAASFGPDSVSNWLAVGDGPHRSMRREDGERGCRIAIWDWPRAEEVKSWEMDGDLVFHLAWSSDGSLLAAACLSDNVHVWDTKGGELVQRLTVGYPVYAVAFLELRDRSAGDLRKTLRFPSHVPTVIMSPGDHLIVGCVDGTVLMHDVAEGMDLELPRMDFDIRSMATSSEGE